MSVQTCRVIAPPVADACGKPATHVVTFSDGDKVLACQACALNMQQLVGTLPGARIDVKRLEA